MNRKRTIGLVLLGLIGLCCVCIGGINFASSLGLIPATTTTNPTAITQIFTPESTAIAAQNAVNTPTIESLPAITPTVNQSHLPIILDSPIPNIDSAACIPTNTRVQKGVVVNVVDGDTIDVKLEDGENFRLRYIGIDTPESGEFCSNEATNFNRVMVEGKSALLVIDVSEVDRYDRLLRYVIVGNIFVNYELVAQGYAQQVSYPPDVACVDTFLEAQRVARENERGCWAATPTATAAPTKPPPPPPPPPPSPTKRNANCHPSYPTVCLKINAGDYDCAGGSGNGPNYVRGPIKVLPPDPFGLDRDGDGIGCE
jgi:endonuclease YncB( thermonuclease family)